jgi:hypothetical protein
MLGVIVVLSLLALLGVWVSLPLLPAVLIYKLFPATQVSAEGPLKGLTIKAGGAFAAYLIVFLLIMPVVYTTRNVIGGAIRPSWEVHGEVRLVDQGTTVMTGQELVGDMKLVTLPSVLTHEAETFTLKVPEEDFGFPTVRIEIPNWGVGYIRNDKLRAGRGSFNKIIDVGEIKIEKTPIARNYDSQLPMTQVGRQNSN